MRESMISELSEGSEQANKNEQQCSFKGTADLTASHTPFLDKEADSLATSRMVNEHRE
jgi:hypothetical protein